MGRSPDDHARPADHGRSNGRVLAVGTLLVGLAALASLRLDGLPQAPPMIAVGNASKDAPAVTATDLGQDCATPTFLRPDGEPVPDGATQRLNANTFRRAFACEASLLSLHAEGSAVDGVGARLIVGWRDRTLLDQPIDGAVDVRVEVPGAGWVVLAFANDLYRPPLDRNLVVSDARLTPQPGAGP